MEARRQCPTPRAPPELRPAGAVAQARFEELDLAAEGPERAPGGAEAARAPAARDDDKVLCRKSSDSMLYFLPARIASSRMRPPGVTQP
jgi:hypothetical protein